MSAAIAKTPVKLDGHRIDKLIQYGMRMFDDAGLYVSPSKMSKLVRHASSKWGYAWTERIIAQYFEAVELLEWESYQRALGGHHA